MASLRQGIGAQDAGAMEVHPATRMSGLIDARMPNADVWMVGIDVKWNVAHRDPTRDERAANW